MKVYLDNCCFNRPYDSLASEIVRMEAEAKLAIQDLIIAGKLELVWSFMLTLENRENPHEEIKNDVATWQKRAIITVNPDPSNEKRAKLLENSGIKSKDAAHVSCAISANSDYLITTDRKLIKKAQSLVNEVKVLNPIEFLAILEGVDEE